jgi:BA14K-like protein.
VNRFLRSAVLGLAVAATTLAALPAAQAGDRWRHGGHYHGHYYSSGDVAAAGAVGLAVGALVGGLAAANSGPVYYRDPPPPRPRPYYRGYYAPPPPPRVAYARPSLEPWTPGWYRYCESRYRSFDPRSGTFMGYDGVRHFCTAN